jgi:MFS family permease
MGGSIPWRVERWLDNGKCNSTCGTRYHRIRSHHRIAPNANHVVFKINMQSAFLIVSKGYSEKQVGVLFFVFGMSQFLFQTPSGYLMDYSDKKILWLSVASVSTTLLTIITAAFAQPEGANLGLMVLIKFLQGAVTSLIPPGLNSITQGIVGAVGMTEQVSMNEMMNHLGTAIIVLSGSLIAYALYPTIGMLFIVSPIACAGVLWFLRQINPNDIDHNAARGLTLESKDKPKEVGNYQPPGARNAKIETQPSFTFGFGLSNDGHEGDLKAETPLQILRDTTLLTFVLIVFLFHTANGTVLPLVMQSLAIGNGRSGILLSGLCIIVAQVFMVLSAKICGTFSGKYGRKTLFLIGLSTVPIRCFILYMLIRARGDGVGSAFLQILILSTQILDGIGAGTFGTMYILVTSDISGGTGRFSLTLGLTTAAMSIGGTVSGYLGEALAEDFGYGKAFFILMFMSLVPALFYFFCMPETLPELSKKDDSYQMESIKEEHHHESDVKRTPAGAEYVELI